MFDPIPGFSIGDFGLYWQMIQAEFPECMAQETIDQAVETFVAESTVRFQLSPEPLLPRCVYRHGERGELIQVQSDRFSFNWIRQPGGVYPRYETTAQRLWQLFEGFASFLYARGLSAPMLTQCEITNVNVLRLSQFGGDMAIALRAVGVQANAPADFGHLRIEGVQMFQHHVILDDNGAPIGRLHTQLQPVIDVESRESALRYDLVARGAPFGSSRSGAEEFFECARSAVNALFLSTTTVEARASWGETS